MNSFLVEDLEIYISGLNKIFDSVRLIDPEMNKIIFKDIIEEEVSGSSCYEFWDKNSKCKNCISRKAAKEKHTFSKIECNSHGMFLVIATSILFEQRELIVEMIKNLDSMSEIYGEKSEVITDNIDLMENLNKKLITDELTASYNRRYINKQLPQDIDYALDNGEDLAILILDIDSFKDINDNYGHMVGDLALKNLINIIKSNIRKKYDWIARFGGDEFVIVLKNANSKVCEKIIKSIQSSLKESSLTYQDNKVDITISIGAYILNNEKKMVDEILHLADENLSIAKNEGKNKYIIS